MAGYAELFTWLPGTALAAWIVSSPYIWPILESIHFVSLCVLFGSILAIDLRLIGVYRVPCAVTANRLIRLSLAAFAINAATGLLFFVGNTYKYVGNPAFELKMALIAAAGINAIYYRARLSAVMSTNDVTPKTIAVGLLSLGFWVGVIVCGRMITFYA